ncbi:hypothetical protein B0J17DRAFT_653488 [Rhizoctonia solani]|nr:hypothetical protein B0J17DRAFT_653488 [Rhizoctonia solani]
MLALDTSSGYTSSTDSSINCLPSELLTEIFWSSIRGDCTFGRIRKAVSRTLTLCSVCSDWRSMILSNPLFWSCIPVGNRAHSYHLTRLCLERSKDSPIDIVIRFRGRSCDAMWSGQQDLIMHCSRIRSIYVSATSSEDIFSLLGRILENQIPRPLTSLSINIRSSSDIISDDDRYSNETAWHKFMQKNIPELCDQLHTLHLDGVSISDFRGWEGSKFGELTELVLSSEHSYYEGMSYIMAVADNLRLLEFHGPVEWVADSTTLKPVLRPDQGVKVLRLHKLPFGTLRQGITWIVPQAGIWETEMSIETRLSQPLWVLRNSSTVTALSLDNSEGPIHTGYYMRRILKALPNLRSLTLERFELGESTLSGLTRPHDAADSEFPRFTVLRLHLSRVLDYDAFKAMIASHPIRRIEIRSCALGWSRRDTNKPDTTSPLYLWLCGRVPEIYVSGP